MEIFEHFRKLFFVSLYSVWAACIYAGSDSPALLTYRQQEITHVHDAQNHVADVRPAIGVCDVHQETCHTVVEEHLPKVFSSFFQVDGEE